MKRIHKSLLWAGLLFGGGVGFGIYTLKTDVKTADERIHDEVLKRRLFKEEFGLVHVKSGELMTRGTTIAFSLEEGDDFVSGGVFSFKGEGAFLVDCSLRG